MKQKEPQSNRPVNQKRCREADGYEMLNTPLRNSRSTRRRLAAGPRQGRLHNNGGPLSTDLSTQDRLLMAEACSEPPPPGWPNPLADSAPEKPMMVETCSELSPPPGFTDPLATEKPLTEEKAFNPVCQPPQFQQVPTGREMLLNGKGSPPRICNVCYRKTGQSTSDSVVELGSAPLSRSAQFRNRLQDVSNRASQKWSDSRDLYQQIRDIVTDPGIMYPVKGSLIYFHILKFIGLREKNGQADIRNLAHEALFELAHMEHQCQSSTSVLQKELQETRSASQREKEALQKAIVDLRAELVRLNVINAEQEATAGQKSVCHHVECDFPSSLKQMTQMELLEKSLSLNETSRLVTEELQKRSKKRSSVKILHNLRSPAKLDPPEPNGHTRSSHREHEAGVKYHPGEADAEEQLRPLSGSYSGESAMPNLLDRAICYAKDELIRFQKIFFDAFKKSAMDKPRGKLNPIMFFARKNHVNFFVESVVNEVLFQGFENESFNPRSSVSMFPDPKLRQTMFYDYYNDKTDNVKYVDADPEFQQFYEAKASCLSKVFEDDDGDGIKVCSFEELGGSTKSRAQLAFSFRAAAKTMWLLHKLSFSFEPPACLFRVIPGADIDPNYMETVVNVEDNPRFVSEVGFVITPGLRLRNKVMMRCKVYLSATDPVKVGPRRPRNPKARKC